MMKATYERKRLIWAYDLISQGRAHGHCNGGHGIVVKNLRVHILIHRHNGVRERGRQTHRERDWECNGHLKPQSRSPVTHLFIEVIPFPKVIFPKQFYRLGTSIQTYDSMGTVLIHTTTPGIGLLLFSSFHYNL